MDEIEAQTSKQNGKQWKVPRQSKGIKKSNYKKLEYLKGPLGHQAE